MNIKDLTEYYRNHLGDENIKRLEELESKYGVYYICKEGYVFYSKGETFRVVKTSKERSPRVHIYTTKNGKGQVAFRVPRLMMKYFGEIDDMSGEFYNIYQIDGDNQNNAIENLIAIPKKNIR